MTTASVLQTILNLINTQGPALFSPAISANATTVRGPDPSQMPAVIVAERSDRFPDRLVTMSAQRLHAWRVDVHGWKAYSDNPPTEADEADWQTFEAQIVNVFAQAPLLGGAAKTESTWLSEEQGGDTWSVSRSLYETPGSGAVVRHLVLTYNVSERYQRVANGYLG